MLLRSGHAERTLRRLNTGAEEVTRSLVTEITAVNVSSMSASGTSKTLLPRGMRPTLEENLEHNFYKMYSISFCSHLSEVSVHKDPGLEFQILDPRARCGWTLS